MDDGLNRGHVHRFSRARCGGSLHAVCARPHTRELLWLTGVDRRIPLTATVDGALMVLTTEVKPLRHRNGPRRPG